MIENIEELEKNETKKMLESFELPINWLSMKLVITAIPYAIDKIASNEKIVMNDLYQYVAKKHRTTASKVNCAIRYLLENTDISQKLNCTKLTNQRLILLIAKKIIDKLNI